MDLTKFAIIGMVWVLFFGGIIAFYWEELSLTDRYFIIGGEAVFLGIVIYLAIRIYLGRDNF